MEERVFTTTGWPFTSSSTGVIYPFPAKIKDFVEELFKFQVGTLYG